MAGATAGPAGGVAWCAHAVASAALDAFVAAGASFVDDADIGRERDVPGVDAFRRARAGRPVGGGGLRPSCQKCAKRFDVRAFVDDYGIAAR